jgi:hypothetical protein
VSSTGDGVAMKPEVGASVVSARGSHGFDESSIPMLLSSVLRLLRWRLRTLRVSVGPRI